jgi:ABC-type bacteriocin/lantibiotic exporter with double-glycine peptidase domain
MSWIENNEWLKPDKEHRIRWDSMRRFLEHYRPHRARLAAAGGLALVASSTILLIPWIFRGLQIAFTGRNGERITWMILAFLGVTLLEICVSAGIRLLQSQVSIQLNRDLLLRYYGKILNLAIEDFIAFRQRTNLFQRIIDAMSVTGSFTTILVRGGQVTIAVGALAVAVAMLSPAVLGILALGSAALFIHVFFQARTISALQKKLLAINYPLVGKMTEVLEGLFTIKALAASVRVTSDISDLVHRKADAEYRQLATEARSDQITQVIRQTVLVGALALSFVLMSSGKLILADVLALYFLTGLLLQSVVELALSYQMLAKLSANVANIYEILDLEDEDAPARLSLAARDGILVAEPQPPRALPAHGALGHIAFRGVDFTYRNGHRVLSGVDLEIRPGEKVCLIGRSGAGKTTLLRILLGFLQPQEGEILVDGMSLAAVTDKSRYRRRFGVVSQNDFLFDTSLRENMTFGLFDEIPDERISDALRRVDLWNDVEGLKLGLATRFSRDLFSGGQKQRFFIARALLRNPSIVLLDEPTSALDFETEKRVIAAIDHLVGGKTTITIAHRLSTVRNADRVIVLRDGRIEASGPHDDLYRSSLYYRALCDYNSFMVA